MSSAAAKMTIGQILLVVCCVFYLIWWSLSYRPNETVNRAGGLNGLLLLVTAVAGLAGVVMSLQGVIAVPEGTPAKLNGTYLAVGAVIAYDLLLILTNVIFHRQTTTELLLIVGWMVLELTVISSLNADGKLSDARFWIMIVVLAAAFLISMILYVLYYRMEPMKAFYAAMVPLITEGVSMVVLLVLTWA